MRRSSVGNSGAEVRAIFCFRQSCWRRGAKSRCPLYPRKRTSLNAIGMSALCQKRTCIVVQVCFEEELARTMRRQAFVESVSAKTSGGYFAPLILPLTHLSTSLARFSGDRLLAPCSVSIQQSSEARCCVRGCGAASVAGASLGYPIRISLTVGLAARICGFEEAYSLFGDNAPIIFADTFGSARSLSPACSRRLNWQARLHPNL